MKNMKNINSKRVFKRNEHEANEQGDFVLYWMQINRRLHYNYALEYAVGWANKLGKPLLIYEGLNADYPWASKRPHQFILQGMAEHVEQQDDHGASYYSFVEKEPGEGKGLLYKLAERSAAIISDEYPVFIMREHNERVSQRVSVPYITVDSNGLIPLQLTDKDPYSAYFFRKTMQKHFVEAYTHPPKENPLADLEHTESIRLNDAFLERYPRADERLEDIDRLLEEIPFEKDIAPLDMDGTRKGGLNQLDGFVNGPLLQYDDDRNDPDKEATSGLSPWLHFGKVSEYEAVKAALEKQPKGWSLDSITFNKGSTGGFFNGDPNIDGFLDEIITWREVGFHFAHHRPDYAEFESLPDWVLETLNEHRDDPREYIYSFEEFEQAKTHDEIWNAAQRQLVRDGIIHNYLRMLWGKKILEWTPDPETALQYMIDLNNWYAIDGRDPNSYSGIFWVLGRFDRAWQERPIYGKLRYMTSDSTRKKVKLKEYLKEYGKAAQSELNF
jgi:deoxyribodipyrimidine photo-lyase